MDLDALRDEAEKLQNAEIKLLKETQTLARRQRTKYRLALKALGSQMQTVLDTDVRLHKTIGKLLRNRGLDDIPEAEILQQIVDCQQKLVEIHSEVLSKIRSVMSQSGEQN